MRDVKSVAALRTIGSGTEVAHENKRCRRSIGIAGEESGQFFHHFWIVKMDISSVVKMDIRSSIVMNSYIPM